MHQIQIDIGIPKIKVESSTDNQAVFSIAPLPNGYGTTLGNSLRRVLLSSLPGAAVTGVKINGVTHEYTTVPGAKDSVLDITLNLKLLKLKKENSEPSILTLKVNKAGIVTAKNIKTPAEVEILNKDQYITTLDKGNSNLEMEIIVEKGVGYIPANSKQNDDAQLISVDAFFTPVKKISYLVEDTRVKDMTNLDKLILDVSTDGSITPEDSVKFASNLLTSYFNLFNEEQTVVEPDFISDIQSIAAKEEEESKNKPSQESYTPIEILGLSPRSLNALINAEIGSIEQLTQCSEAKLSNFRGFGKKALSEVSEALATRGLSLADD